MKHILGIGFLLIGVIIMSCQQSKPVIEDFADISHVKSQLEKYVPVEIDYDDSALSEGDKQALAKIVEAAKLMDEIFLRQVYGNNVAILQELNTGRQPEYGPLKEFFTINFGPFDRLDEDRPFINTATHKPDGANFYPEDMSKEEFEQYLQAHPDQDSSLTGYFTIIRREGAKLVPIPYSDAYRVFLEPAAQLLGEAAELTDNASLSTYLKSRADAFLSNDYFQSDMDWMDLNDHDIEVVIGPYEVYEDEMFNYKASFESFVTLVDREDSKRLQALGKYLNDLERRLPIPEEHKNYNRGSSSPIVVVNEVFTAGDTKAGVQTIAFNLPNDERVREAKGSKKVMLKNVSQAKYENISKRIIKEVMAEKDAQKASFDAFFYHVLLHEMVHGIGPGNIVKDGKKTTVARELKETYSTLEEAKADIVGLYQFPYLAQKGVFDRKLADEVYASFVGGIFRSVRFGIDEAHGGGNAIILNYLVEKGGVEFDAASERFRVNDKKIAEAVKGLSREILMIQANGDYEGAKALIAKYRKISPELQTVLDKLTDVPVDIRPVYAVEKHYQN